MLNNSSSKRQLAEDESVFPSSHSTESSPPPPAKKIQICDERQHQPLRRCIVCQSARKSKVLEASDELIKAVKRLQSAGDPALICARSFGGVQMEVHELCKRKVWAAVKKLKRTQDKAPSCGLKTTKKMCMVCNKEKSPGKKQLRQLFPATAELLEAVTALEKARDPNVSGWSVKILQKTVPNSLPSAACNQDEQLLIHAICRQNIWNAHRALQLRVEKDNENTQIVEMMNDNEGKFVARTHTSPQLLDICFNKLASFVEAEILVQKRTTIFTTLMIKYSEIMEQAGISSDEKKKKTNSHRLRLRLEHHFEGRVKFHARASKSKSYLVFSSELTVTEAVESVTKMAESLQHMSEEDDVGLGGCRRDSGKGNSSPTNNNNNGGFGNDRGTLYVLAKRIRSLVLQVKGINLATFDPAEDLTPEAVKSNTPKELLDLIGWLYGMEEEKEANTEKERQVVEKNVLVTVQVLKMKSFWKVMMTKSFGGHSSEGVVEDLLF